jgi:hypothetical protein
LYILSSTNITLIINNYECLENECARKKFLDWGVLMRPNPVILEGPVYKRETILLGNSIRKQVGPNMDWGIDMAKNAMFVAVSKLFYF